VKSVGCLTFGGPKIAGMQLGVSGKICGPPNNLRWNLPEARNYRRPYPIEAYYLLQFTQMLAKFYVMIEN
jgi:hypothetical protein